MPFVLGFVLFLWGFFIIQSYKILNYPIFDESPLPTNHQDSCKTFVLPISCAFLFVCFKSWKREEEISGSMIICRQPTYIHMSNPILAHTQKKKYKANLRFFSLPLINRVLPKHKTE